MTKSAISTREVCMVSLFTAITVVLAQIVLVLPFTPVPISFGIAAVYICGMLLRPKCAFLTQICYLLLGAVGVPVFSYFRGGLQMLAGPTGGYLFVYPAVALMISLVLNGERALGRTSAQTTGLYVRTVLVLVLGLLLFYLSGTAWMALISGITFFEAAALAAYPFIPMDIVKIALCVLGVLPVRRRLIRLGFLV